MSIPDLRERRGMSFLKRGMKVEVNGQIGKLIGGDCYGLLVVDFDGERKCCNPKYKTRFFDAKDKVIADYYK